jgi:hypothetical protein
MAKYDKPLDNDEDEGGNHKYRLPYALCKARGIHVPEGATPRDAWNLLKGMDVNPDKEYKRMYDRLNAKKKRQEQKERKRQANDSEHSPDYSYVHEEGKIAGVSKGEPMTFEQADGMRANPNYGKKGLFGYSTNCQACVVAFEARMRGYDVQALPNNRNGYIRDLSYSTNLAYRDQYGNHPDYIRIPSGVRRTSYLNQTVREGNRYSIEWAWTSGNVGHIINVTKENGALKFYDPQTGKVMSESDFNSRISPSIRAGSVKLMRVDNLEFDSEFIDKVLKGASKK